MATTTYTLKKTADDKYEVYNGSAKVLGPVEAVGGKVTFDGFGVFDINTKASITFKASSDWKFDTDVNIAVAKGSGDDTYVSDDAAVTSIDFDDVTKGIKYTADTDDVTIVGGSGNDTISVPDTATKVASINAGAGNDLVSIETIAAANSVTLGAGKDTLYVKDAAGIGVNVEDYSYSDGDLISLSGAAATVSVDNKFTVAGSIGASVVGSLEAEDSWYSLKVDKGSNAINEYFTASGDKSVVSKDLSKSTAKATFINTENDNTIANITLGKEMAEITLAAGNKEADTIVVGKASANDAVKTINNFESDDILSLSGAKLNTLEFGLNAANVTLGYGASTVSLVGANTVTGGSSFYIDNGSKKKVAYAYSVSGSAISYAVSSDADWFVGNTDGNTILEVGATTHLHETDKYKDITKISVAGSLDLNSNLYLTGAKDKENEINAASASVGVGVWGYSSKADHITLGSAQDTVYFGAGDGSDVVTNFAFGSDTDSDILYLYDTKTLGDIKVAGDGTNAKVTAGKSVASITGADGANDIALVQLADGKVYTVAGAYKTANVVTVNTDKTELLDYYAFDANKKQEVKITGSKDFIFNTLYTDFMTAGANVATINASSAEGNVTLAGAANIAGGRGTNEIWTYKSDANATVTAGDGTDNIWFADGFDKSVTVTYFDTDADTVKFALAGSLKDIAEGYKFKDVSDNAVITGKSGSKLTVQGKTEFSISDGAGKTYKALAGAAGATKDFVDDVNIYGGMSKLKASAAVDGNVVVRVGKNSNGVASENYYVDDSVKEFDASASAASFVIAGSSEHANTLKGGLTDNMLYGGGSYNDELVGSVAAVDTFFFGTGDGKDTVSGGLDSADKVALWNVADADIANVTVTLDEKAGTAKVVLSDASTLSITDGTAAELIKDGLTFVSATNTAYKYDSETGKLVQKA